MRTTAALVLVLALTAACGEDFQAPSELEELRILMLRATPIELQAGDEVVLERVVFVPEGEQIVSDRWSFCPFTAGAFASFACAGCEMDIAPDPDTGELRFDPLALAASCPELAGLFSGGASGGEEVDPDAIPDYVETLFRSVVTTDSGESVEAVVRVPVWLTGPPASDNGHPVIEAVTLEGVLPDEDGRWPAAAFEEERELRVIVDEASLDTYLDSAGDEHDESAIVSFYATGGELQWNRRPGTDVEVRWTAPEAEDANDEVQIYVVARDLRGGQDLRGPYTLAVEADGEGE